MKLGFPIPNCREGRDELPGDITPRTLVELARECERLGFDAGWANDYITTPASTAYGFDLRPSWYESLLSLCAIAMKTERIKLGVAVIVMPFREPVVLAKQAITLDHFSNGRLLLGIGLGDSRAEFVSIKPREAKAHRGRMLDEGLEAVSRLLSEPESSYDGENYAHDGVIFFPRPVQDPLPIYIAGHSATTPQRIARHAHGWLVSYPSLESFKADWPVVEEAMHAQGRTMSELDITTTWGMRLDRTREKALSNYKNSAQERLKTSGPLERSDAWYTENNLIGTPEDVAEFLLAFRDAGATHGVPLHIAADSLPELQDQLQLFAEEVMPLVRAG